LYAGEDISSVIGFLEDFLGRLRKKGGRKN
jgi:hypothetical protein